MFRYIHVHSRGHEWNSSINNSMDMRVQAGSDGAVAAHIFLGQRLSCNRQRWDRLHALAINFRTCWETKNCSKLQSIARFVDFNCVLMQLIAPCNRALIQPSPRATAPRSPIQHRQVPSKSGMLEKSNWLKWPYVTKKLMLCEKKIDYRFEIYIEKYIDWKKTVLV